MRTPRSLSGIDLVKALSLAADAGCLVRYPRGTGEVLVIAPGNAWRVRTSRRRKSSPRSLSGKLARLLRCQPGR
jgi:hypothetical protein